MVDPSSVTTTPAFLWTELRELQFQCYAIAVPAGLGIAVAAALGLAKVGIMGVTIYVKVTEWFFKMTKNPPRKLQEVCCRNGVNRILAILIYFILSSASFLIVSVIASLSGLIYAELDAD